MRGPSGTRKMQGVLDTSVSRVLDYKKAFDSMEISVVLKALNTIRINAEYIDLLQELNVDCRTEIKDVSRPHQYL